MKIHANLIASPPRMALPLAVALWVLCASLITTAFMLTLEALEMRAEAPRLEERLSRLSEQIKAIAVHESVPPAAELEAMRRRVSALNSLSGLRGWSTPQLLSWFEQRLPDNVSLVSLHHKPRDGEILLVAESPSAESLTAFLLRLEKEPQFSEVLLSKQGTRSGAGAAALQFEIRARQKL
jgi:hypothetical protein